MKENYIRLWLRDFWGIFTHELKTIFCDGGVLIIFFVAGLGYPLLYNLVYRNGILEDTPIAVVDRADCSESGISVRLMPRVSFQLRTGALTWSRPAG